LLIPALTQLLIPAVTIASNATTSRTLRRLQMASGSSSNPQASGNASWKGRGQDLLLEPGLSRLGFPRPGF